MRSDRAALLMLWCCAGTWPLAAEASPAAPRGRSARVAIAEPTATPTLDPRFGAGEPSSPVVLTLYACGRSERCAKLIPPLYQEVVSGRLKGKVRLYYRPFCTRTDEGTMACCRALVAAARQGSFWPYLLHLYAHQEDFQSCLLKKWADVKGLDGDAFELSVRHDETTALLAEARREAVEAGVVTVPSAFVGGRKVPCELSLPALVDYLEREAARKARQ